MKLRIFACDSVTESECFERSLFGDSRAWPLNVSCGELCLLYNYNTKMLHGIWITKCNGKKDIVPSAWNGKYKYQVRVELASKERISIPDINTGKLFPNLPNWYKQSTISGSHANDILDYFASVYNIPRERGADNKEIEQDYRLKYPRQVKCDDGHSVRSKSEYIIDNWLSQHRIYHEYERLINIPEMLIPDFTIYDRKDSPVYIEHWGLLSDSAYQNRRMKKCKIYVHYQLPLIEMYESDIQNIDFSLRTKLIEKNIGII